MRATRILFPMIGLLIVADASAQQVTVETPYQVLGDSFYENMGMSWGLRGKNWALNVGGSPVQAAPQYGGFDPSAGATFGAGFNRGGVSGQFNANMSQGVRRSFTGQAPSVTLQNGVPGFVSDTSVSPFVISYIPVVGGFAPNTFPGVPYGMTPYNNMAPMAPYNMAPMTPMTPMSINRGMNPAVRPVAPIAPIAIENPLMNLAPARNRMAPPARNRMAPPARNNQPKAAPQDGLVLLGNDPVNPAAKNRPSSAEVPAMSVEAARRVYAKEQAAKQTEKNEKTLIYLEHARNAEAIGKPNVAKIYYQMALQHATENQKTQILYKLRKLATP